MRCPEHYSVGSAKYQEFPSSSAKRFWLRLHNSPSEFLSLPVEGEDLP